MLKILFNNANCQFTQVLEYLKKVNYTSKTGEQIFFDSKGDPAARYELVSWQPDGDGTVQFRTVGIYDTSMPSDQRFVLNRGGMTWAGGQTKVTCRKIRALYNNLYLSSLIFRKEFVNTVQLFTDC